MAASRQDTLSLKHELRRFLWRFGYDVAPFEPGSHAIARRRQLFQSLLVDLVLDVGANEGQFALELRRDFGYTGRICSFEPTSAAFRTLQERAAPDPKWTVFNIALGEERRRATMNIAANLQSSSLLPMLEAHVEAAPDSVFVRTEDVEIERLDAIFEDLRPAGAEAYLKIDTQGFESAVLRGADRSLGSIGTVQLEMPLQPLYEGEESFDQLRRFLVERGYTMVGLDPVFANPSSGRLLQIDGVFHRDPDDA